MWSAKYNRIGNWSRDAHLTIHDQMSHPCCNFVNAQTVKFGPAKAPLELTIVLCCKHAVAPRLIKYHSYVLDKLIKASATGKNPAMIAKPHPDAPIHVPGQNGKTTSR